MGQGKRAGGVLLAAALAATAGACGVLGGEAEEADDEIRLVEAINEGYRLESELNDAEFRIIQECLKDQGHTVHDQWEFQTWSTYEQESLTEYSPTESFLPEADVAAKWGFGNWADTDEGWESDDAEEYQDELWGSDDDLGETMPDADNDEFDALPAREQYDWYAAYHGEDYAEEYYSWLLDEDYDAEEAAEDASGEGRVEGEFEVDGELELETESWDEPAPGGCKLEMIEALYGEPEQIKENDGDGSYSYWSWGPTSPEHDVDWEEPYLTYRDKVQDEEYDFLDCVAERGHGDWGFNEWGDLPLWAYFDAIYYEDGDEGSMFYAGDAGGQMPDAPEDLPADFEGKKAYEIAVAVDFVECGQESGYKEAADKAWAEVQIDHYLAMEEDLYAWQEELRDAIGKAQEMIDS